MVVFFAIGFFIFYAIDNPDLLSNFKSKFSGSGEQEIGAAETMAVEVEEVQEQPQVQQAETQEPVEEEVSLWDKIGNFFNRGSYGDEGQEELSARLTINFYFASLGQEMLLEPEERTIVAGTRESALINATKELLKGPSKSYLFPVIPGGTNLIDTEVNENLAKVNLSQEFLDNSLDNRMLDEMVIYSIVNTLTEIPGIEGVIFNIEGTRIKVYGNVDLSLPAIRKEELIAVEE